MHGSLQHALNLLLRACRQPFVIERPEGNIAWALYVTHIYLTIAELLPLFLGINECAMPAGA